MSIDAVTARIAEIESRMMSLTSGAGLPMAARGTGAPLADYLPAGTTSAGSALGFQLASGTSTASTFAATLNSVTGTGGGSPAATARGIGTGNTTVPVTVGSGASVGASTVVGAGKVATPDQIPGAGPTTATSGVARYEELFADATARYRLPAGLLAAVAQVESGGNPRAVSPAGAQGLMQIMPATARSLGVDPMNVQQAISGAARLLREGLDRFSSLDLALASYNAGPGAVQRYGGVPPYTETQAYVRKVKALSGVTA